MIVNIDDRKMVLKIPDFIGSKFDEFEIGGIDLTDLAVTSLTLKILPGRPNEMAITLLCGEVDVEALVGKVELDIRHWNLDGTDRSCNSCCKEKK